MDTKGLNSFGTPESVAPFIKCVALGSEKFNIIPTSKDVDVDLGASETGNAWSFPVEENKEYSLVYVNDTAITYFNITDQDGEDMTVENMVSAGHDPMWKQLYFKTNPGQTGIIVVAADSTELATILDIKLFPFDMGYVRGIKFEDEDTYNLMYGKPVPANGVHSLYRAGMDYVECPSRVEVYTATGSAPSLSTATYSVTCVDNTWYDLVFYLGFVEITTEKLSIDFDGTALVDIGDATYIHRGWNKVRFFSQSTSVTFALESAAIADAMETGIKCYKVTNPTLEIGNVKY